MKTLKNKTMATMITLFLILTITATSIFFVLPIASGHTPPWTVKTYCYCTVTDDTIGVGQQDLIVFWINNLPPTAQGQYGDRWTFYVNVTKPSGSTDNFGPITSDPVGGSYLSYIPTELGNYTAVAYFIGRTITNIPHPPPGWGTSTGGTANQDLYINDTYSPSTSLPVSFATQQQAIPVWPEAPLPTDYWTRPINSMNRGWSVIAANWLSGAAQTNGPTTSFQWGKGPTSAHIMWTTPFWAGGVMDARTGVMNYETFHYEGLGFTPPIILNGRIYYNARNYPREGWYCLDLTTGKQLYFYNTTGPVTGIGTGFSSAGSITQQSLSFGEVYNYYSPNQIGGFPYLWSTSGAAGTPTTSTTLNVVQPTTTWNMYDAYTGNYICSIANTTQTAGAMGVTTGATGTQVYGQDGSILYYNIVNLGTTASPKDYLQTWNNTYAIWYPQLNTTSLDVTTINGYWMWRPILNYTFNGAYGFTLNASIPAVQGTIQAVREGQFVIGGTAGTNNEAGITKGDLWALNLKPDSDGVITPTLLWNITFTPPSSAGNLTVSLAKVDPEDEIFEFTCTQLLTRYVYSLTTGQLLWTSAPEFAMNYYGMSTNIYNGMLLGSGSSITSGQIIAYNATTGQILWKYDNTNQYSESPYGGDYPNSISIIADGKAYMGTSTHHQDQPLYRGRNLQALNLSTGKIVWNIDFFGSGMALADGNLVALNFFDNQLYCFGQGPSKLTVTAPDTATSVGTPVVIRGTVTDVSVGTTQQAQAANFPNGVPLVSDDSMNQFMEYVYEQQPASTNATGVPVTLSVIDSNGNLRQIGSTTSDASGMFSFIWTPDIPGLYTIIATFAGSQSYYRSSAETSIAATAASTVTPAATSAPTSEADTYFVPAIAGLFVLIIIVLAVVVLLMLRKRP